MPESIILIAASGLAREVIDAVLDTSAQRVVGCLDDAPERTAGVFPVAVLGPVDAAVEHPDAAFLVCAGHGRVRRSIVSRLSILGITAERFTSVVHPSVRVPASCTVGAGSIILANSVLTSAVSVGRHVVVMPQVTLTHDDVIDDYATLCAGATLGGSVRVGEAAYLGMSCAVRQDLTIGADATLGMGSVVTKDVPAHETWVGLPARRFEGRQP